MTIGTAITTNNPEPAIQSSPRSQASRSHSTRSRYHPATVSGGPPPQRAASSQQHKERHSSSHSRTRSGSHSRQPSSSTTRPAQDTISQHDYETSNVATHPKRNSLRDQDNPTATSGGDTARLQRRASTRSTAAAATASHLHHHRHHRDQSQQPGMAANATVANTSGPTPVTEPRASTSAQTKHGRGRTTIPTSSGKWILGKTIGAGSMGKVKLARKEDSPEQVACKIIPRGSTEDNHQSRADKERADQSKEIRTAREAAIVTLLSHPNVTGLRDVVRTNYHWYMLFEYVNGGQMLDYIISHGKLKEKQARKFSRQIASALDYCHRNSIVHRDLKIENILISKNGDIKIIDFGLSNLFAPRGYLKTFCGSLYFAAPELLQARAYTGPEVDVWSFGIVLYVLVCGKVPFDDQSMPALHAKIKKGLVDYPNWLSSECKHLLSRMLVTDPKQRAGMVEVMNHPWMIKGYGGPPDNHVPVREPLALPLENEVIIAMTGFNFGSPENIKAQLTRIIESEEYQRALRLYQREKELPPPAKDIERKRGFGFDFYKRRNSGNSRDTLTAPSSEGLQMGSDPLNAFSPLISIYHLVREKQERDRIELQSTFPDVQKDQKEKDVPNPEIAHPQEAHTNTGAYEMPGENATGGRSRPRARTQGEDDVPETARQSYLSPSSAQPPEPPSDAPSKKESTAAGILRRFSTRRRREPERLEKDRSHPPVVQVRSPSEAPTAIRKSFSIRRSRREPDEPGEPRLRSESSQPHHGGLLSPPPSAGGGLQTHGKGLGRSTSVNSADLRRRNANSAMKEPPPTSGSDQSASDNRRSEQRGASQPHSVAMRTKSLGHARRESIQRRRQRREEVREADVPEETDQDLGDQSGLSTEQLDSSELAKPIFFKGLFSVSTTSGKSVPEIRADIKRVLKHLGVDYTEIKGGFSCRHTPSIDLKRAQESPSSPAQAPGHRRRFSFGGIRGGGEREREELRDPDRGPPIPRTPGKGVTADQTYSNSDISEDSVPRSQVGPPNRAPGETSTHVQSDLGGDMVLEFEIFIVKVPLLSLHGIHFKRLLGNTWQYKNMADQVLKELRL